MFSVSSTSLHVCLTSLQAREGYAEELIADLRKSIAEVKVNPPEVEGVVSKVGFYEWDGVLLTVFCASSLLSVISCL